MNVTAVVLFLAFVALALGSAGRWFARSPAFDIAGISVLGDTGHNNAVTLRANVAPRLQGTFFTVDLARVRAAFESVPWVRKAGGAPRIPEPTQGRIAGAQGRGLLGP